jgi:6-phosphogluconolactonase (cycloisomerase 2 family)
VKSAHLRRVAALALPGLLTAGAAVASTPPAAAGPALAEGDRLYVTNSALQQTNPATANVARFGIDGAGLVSPAGTEPAGHGSRGIVFTAPANTMNQRYAYVSSQLAGEIGQYRVAADGALTRIGATKTEQPFGIATHPSGGTVYVANADTGEPGDNLLGAVSAYQVESTGDLTPRNSVQTWRQNAKGVAVTPNGRFLYVTHGPQSTGPSFLTGYALTTTGAIGARVTEVTIGSSGHRVVITPDGRFAYVTNQENQSPVGDVLGFEIASTGALTPAPGNPVEAGIRVEGAALTPDGRLYVSAIGVVGGTPVPAQDGEVRGFDIGPDGRLTQIEQIKFGADPDEVAAGLDGRNLYVVDFQHGTVTVFAVDAAGRLGEVQTVSSQGPNPAFQSVTVQPGGVPR